MSDSELPTCLFGYVRGPLRFERCGGQDYFYTDAQAGRFLVNVKPCPPLSNVFAVSSGDAGKYWAVTHLQKKSRFGFLLMKPFIFHFWLTFKFQEQDKNGGWVPDSEKVFYVRTPGKRWDAGDCTYIDSKGYLNLSLHWD